MKKISVNKNLVLDVLKSTVISVIITLILVLAFALIVNLLTVNDGIIQPINQVIKVISILVGCFIGFKDNRQGIFKGAVSGLLYTILSILIFGLISHSVKINAMSLVDVVLGIVAGAISGILAVNLRKKDNA